MGSDPCLLCSGSPTQQRGTLPPSPWSSSPSSTVISNRMGALSRPAFLQRTPYKTSFWVFIHFFIVPVQLEGGGRRHPFLWVPCALADYALWSFRVGFQFLSDGREKARTVCAYAPWTLGTILTGCRVLHADAELQWQLTGHGRGWNSRSEERLWSPEGSRDRA